MSLRSEPIGAVPAETVCVARVAFSVRHAGDAAARRVRRALPRRGLPGSLPRPGPARLGALAARLGDGVPVSRAPERPAGGRCGAGADRGAYALGLELTDPGFHFSVLSELKRPAGGRRCGPSAARRDAGAFQGQGAGPPARPAAHGQHARAGGRARLAPARAGGRAARAPRWTISPRSRRSGCAASSVRSGSSATGAGSRTTACPSAGRSARRSPLMSARTAFTCSTSWTRPEPHPRPGTHRWSGGSRDVWRVHDARGDDGRPRWRTGAELPPVGERLQSPCDPQMHSSTKRGLEWSGYLGRTSPRPATRTPRT